MFLQNLSESEKNMNAEKQTRNTYEVLIIHVVVISSSLALSQRNNKKNELQFGKQGFSNEKQQL